MAGEVIAHDWISVDKLNVIIACNINVQEEHKVTAVSIVKRYRFIMSAMAAFLRCPNNKLKFHSLKTY